MTKIEAEQSEKSAPIYKPQLNQPSPLSIMMLRRADTPGGFRMQASRRFTGG